MRLLRVSQWRKRLCLLFIFLFVQFYFYWNSWCASQFLIKKRTKKIKTADYLAKHIVCYGAKMVVFVCFYISVPDYKFNVTSLYFSLYFCFSLRFTACFTLNNRRSVFRRCRNSKCDSGLGLSYYDFCWYKKRELYCQC